MKRTKRIKTGPNGDYLKVLHQGQVNGTIDRLRADGEKVSGRQETKRFNEGTKQGFKTVIPHGKTTTVKTFLGGRMETWTE